jgi:hypothetical protein
MAEFHGDVLTAIRVKQREMYDLLRVMEGAPRTGRLRSDELARAGELMEEATTCAERYALRVETKIHNQKEKSK